MGSSNNIKNQTISGLFWRFMERFGAQGVTFIVSIILARLLDPKVYGTVALIAVFTSVLGVFVDSGMGNALIQKKDADELDYSSVFYFNVVMCTALYIALFMLAPQIASFYNNDNLVAVIRVMGLTLIVSGVKNIQQAYVSKHLLFKRFFYATLGGTVGAAIVGIAMAYRGFGVWALVAQDLFNSVVDTVILWITVKWRPKRVFSFSRLKELFSYGWKLLVSSLLDTVYNRFRSLIIGKIYSPEDLAFYEKGGNFPYLVITNVNASIDSVLFPVMSHEQNDWERVRDITRRAIKTSSYLIWPCMMGLAACANPLIKLLLTDKWLPCVPFLRVFCLTYAFFPIHTANLNAIKALGRSDLFLKLELLKKTVGIILLLISIQFGVMAIAYSLLISTVISMIINSWPNRKMLCYSIGQQIKDILPSFAMSLVMFCVVWCVQYLKIHTAIVLLLQIFLGILVYLVGSKVFRIESYEYILRTGKEIFQRR